MSVIRWSSVLISQEGAGGLPHVGLGAILGSCIWFCKNWKTFDDLGVEVEGCVGHRRVMTRRETSYEAAATICIRHNGGLSREVQLEWEGVSRFLFISLKFFYCKRNSMYDKMGYVE